MSERPDLPFVVHPISHAWFHEPVVLWHQFDSMLRVQAMWNDVYIVSAGNHVSGKMYTPNGEVKPPNPLIEGDWWTVRQTDIPY